MKIQGKLVDGEVYLSVNTIKQILTTDLVVNLEDKAAGIQLFTSTQYIKDLIERIDKISAQ